MGYMLGMYLRELVRQAVKSSWVAANGLAGGLLGGGAMIWRGVISVVSSEAPSRRRPIGRSLLLSMPWFHGRFPVRIRTALSRPLGEAARFPEESEYLRLGPCGGQTHSRTRNKGRAN
jgi:hypothetical protein